MEFKRRIDGLIIFAVNLSARSVGKLRRNGMKTKHNNFCKKYAAHRSGAPHLIFIVISCF